MKKQIKVSVFGICKCSACGQTASSATIGSEHRGCKGFDLPEGFDPSLRGRLLLRPIHDKPLTEGFPTMYRSVYLPREGSKKRADGTYSERDLDKFPTIQPMPGKWAAFDPSAVEASQPSV